METGEHREGVAYLEKFISRKDRRSQPRLDETPDSLPAWVGRYLELAVIGVRSEMAVEKAALHLWRFTVFFRRAYGHYRVLAVVRRDVPGWQRSRAERELAPATVNNHLASLSVEVVASEARMSHSSSYNHLKEVTSISPLQHQKRLRLQETRRLILGSSLDAAAAGFSVGHESTSQFSREYSRLFGAPPLRDTENLKVPILQQEA